MEGRGGVNNVLGLTSDARPKIALYQEKRCENVNEWSPAYLVRTVLPFVYPLFQLRREPCNGVIWFGKGLLRNCGINPK